MAARGTGPRHAARRRVRHGAAARQAFRGDHPRLFLPCAGSPGRRLLGRRLSVHYLLSHRTTYTYASTVDSAHHIAHLRARDFPGQKVSSI
ncbi:MAG: hypothetical protein EPO10_26070, partial [Reyranella sp.]